jgi:hypothetical protein
MTPAEPFEDALAPPAVRGWLHRPPGTPAAGLVLTHGAGSDCRAPLLVALAEALAARGLAVLRCDLPFRQARPAGPPRPGAATIDRDGLRRAGAALRRLGDGRVVLGGHSYGGRQASMLGAEDPDVADALVLLAYPLSPPSRPDRPRTEHFPRLRVPTLFVHGTRDPFGSVEALDHARELIPARTALLPIEGAGHDLHHARRPGRRGADMVERVVTELLAFLALIIPDGK